MTQKIVVPSKSVRDDGSDNPIGILGFLFGAIIYMAFIYTIIDTMINGF